jgi:transposase
MRLGRPGYTLARELARRGIECVIAAPSKIPRATGDKVKNDRRDAEHLVRLLLAGKLHPVRVPGPEEEALRDLIRARETLRLDLMRARRPNDAAGPGGRDGRAVHRREHLEREIVATLPGSPWETQVGGCAVCAGSTP